MVLLAKPRKDRNERYSRAAHCSHVVCNRTEMDVVTMRTETETQHASDTSVSTSHANYPHEPGRLHTCSACEAKCYCTDPDEEMCVYCYDQGING